MRELAMLGALSPTPLHRQEGVVGDGGSCHSE